MAVRWHSHTHLVAAPAVGMFPFERDAINATYKSRICLCSLVGPLADDFWQETGLRVTVRGDGSFLHVLINLDVTLQRRFFGSVLL